MIPVWQLLVKHSRPFMYSKQRKGYKQHSINVVLYPCVLACCMSFPGWNKMQTKQCLRSYQMLHSVQGFKLVLDCEVAADPWPVSRQAPFGLAGSHKPACGKCYCEVASAQHMSLLQEYSKQLKEAEGRDHLTTLRDIAFELAAPGAELRRQRDTFKVPSQP